MLTGDPTDCLRRYDVVNRGFSGYNTSQALKIFEHLFPEPGPGTPKMECLVSPSHPLRHGCLPARLRQTGGDPRHGGHGTHKYISEAV